MKSHALPYFAVMLIVLGAVTGGASMVLAQPADQANQDAQDDGFLGGFFDQLQENLQNMFGGNGTNDTDNATNATNDTPGEAPVDTPPVAPGEGNDTVNETPPVTPPGQANDTVNDTNETLNDTNETLNDTNQTNDTFNDTVPVPPVNDTGNQTNETLNDTNQTNQTNDTIVVGNQTNMTDNQTVNETNETNATENVSFENESAREITVDHVPLSVQDETQEPEENETEANVTVDVTTDEVEETVVDRFNLFLVDENRVQVEVYRSDRALGLLEEIRIDNVRWYGDWIVVDFTETYRQPCGTGEEIETTANVETQDDGTAAEAEQAEEESIIVGDAVRFWLPDGTYNIEFRGRAEFEPEYHQFCGMDRVTIGEEEER